MKWRHIETAPKDGRQILTFGRNHDVAYASGKPWYQTSFWSEQHKCFVGWPKDIQPTHWQPLPKNPNN